MNTTKLAIVYDRASSEKQKDNWSREDARIIGAQLAEKHGFTKCEVRTEVISGEDLMNRPVMKSVLDDIQKGLVGAIVVQNFSRLSRDEDGIDGYVIKKICKMHDVVIVTSSRVYDFKNFADNRQSALEFLIASWYKDDMMQNTTRGMKRAASAGRYMGGWANLGYKIIYPQQERLAQKPIGDYEINEAERPIIELLFTTYQETHNANQTAKKLNEAGYRLNVRNKKTLKRGEGDTRLFETYDVLRIIKNPIYSGFVAWASRIKQSKYLNDYEPEFAYRPELQIIPITLWEEVNQVRASRSRIKKTPGEWSRYAFSGFLVCLRCGQPLSGYTHRETRPNNGSQEPVICYRCGNYNLNNMGCDKQTTIRQPYVAKVMIPFMAELINKQVGLEDALIDAAETYGKDNIERELEEQIKAKLATVGLQKQNIIRAIGAGIISQDEAKSEMEELRAKENRLSRELSTIGQKEAIRMEWLQAIEAIKGKDVETTLQETLESNSGIFKRLLGMMFKPGSIRILNTRKGNVWTPVLKSYEFTEEFGKLLEQDAIYSVRVSDDHKLQFVIDFSQLFSLSVTA